jgi:hypothetical protein
MIRSNKNQQGWNEYGNTAMSVLYHSHSNEDVINFIENIVLNERDDMKDIRLDFLEKVILPPDGNTASLNIYNSLLNRLSD